MESYAEAVKITRIWVEKQLEEIRNLSYEKHRLILMCSLIDSFAQYVANYNSRTNAKNFSDFLLTYSTKYVEILNAVCPATLYYDKKDKLPDEVGVQLAEHMNVYADSDRNRIEAERLLSLLPEKEREKASEKHQYARLIYAMRNKLVHEMVLIGCPVDFITEDSDPIPHMVMEYRPYPSEETYWTLRIPERFVFEVGESAISNYISECEANKIAPLCMDITQRRCCYAWYDH